MLVDGLSISKLALLLVTSVPSICHRMEVVEVEEEEEIDVGGEAGWARHWTVTGVPKKMKVISMTIITFLKAVYKKNKQTLRFQ